MATIGSVTDNPRAAALDSLGLTGGAKTKETQSTADDQQSRFLRLLTTQLKNQDPLNPMDNAQMTSQMAQISTVDGIERLNKTLTALIDNSNSAQFMQTAALVGHSVFVPGHMMQVGESGGMGGYELTGAADIVNIEIRDANGILMRTIKHEGVQAGVNEFIWDGKTDSGAQVAPGNYSFTMNASQGSNKVTPTRLQLAPVNGVVRSGTGAMLNVGNLGDFAMSDIKQVF